MHASEGMGSAVVTTIAAIIAYLIFYGLFAWLCEKFSPLVMFAGLILVMSITQAMAALGFSG